MGKKKES